MRIGERSKSKKKRLLIVKNKVALKYMIDTCICIYAMNGRMGVMDEWLNHEQGEICISMMTYAELRFGIEKSKRREENLAKLQEFLEGVRILDFDGLAADEYAKVRRYLSEKGEPIGDRDMMIAAHANSLDLTLVTHNVREFARVPGLEVADWA